MAVTTKKLKVTKPVLVAEIKKFDEFKDKKDSALMALKKEVLVATLNRLLGKDADAEIIIDEETLIKKHEEIKSKPKVSKTSTKVSNITSDINFTGVELATEDDLQHFYFGWNQDVVENPNKTEEVTN